METDDLKILLEAYIKPLRDSIIELKIGQDKVLDIHSNCKICQATQEEQIKNIRIDVNFIFEKLREHDTKFGSRVWDIIKVILIGGVGILAGLATKG